eukprot:CAMPEP_0183332856 /NCGR_PEP_ID=MMETSP0164_2-20130417/1916_1 /TAXON_ID=221442 /ORGANISM="Coccolithus pelagicus ssp braarudi, Strain PLY182g" /LENGTH=256 /DNA_ID=CAMNT_0025501663 /DNA_START=167 /DNA_END=937 /DNA_ORIENTATION=-
MAFNPSMLRVPLGPSLRSASGLAQPNARPPNRCVRRPAISRMATVTSEQGGYDGEFVDEQALYASSSFPLKAEELVKLAKRFYSPEVRFGTRDGGECLADDFEFAAAVIGPLSKAQYLKQLKTFNLEDAFDISGNVYGFYVDPIQSERVWYFNRAEATHVGEILGAKPTGQKIKLPPQINFLDFNGDGKVTQYGFYTIDRRQGNTGGLGGAFGYLYPIGRAPPYPEAQPYKKSKRRRLFEFLVPMLTKLQPAGKSE